MELNKNNLFSNLKALAIPFSEVPRNYAKGKVSGAAKVTAFALPLLSVSAALLGVGVLFLMPHQLRNLKLAPVADFMSQHALAFKLSGGITIALGILLATAVLTRSANNLGHLASEPERILPANSPGTGMTLSEEPGVSFVYSSNNNEQIFHQKIGKSILVVHTNESGKVISVDHSDKVYFVEGGCEPYAAVQIANTWTVYKK